LNIKSFKKFIQFGLWGIPGFILSIILNGLFVEFFSINVYISFFYVLLIITVLNFFIVDGIVFKSNNKKLKTKNRFLLFVSVTLSSRALEWTSYSVVIYLFGFHYILVQIGVSATFVLAKFLILRKVMK